MTDRYVAMSVPPDATQSEELRQHLRARLASISRAAEHGQSDVHLDSDHVEPDDLVRLKEVNVPLKSPAGATTNRRRMLMTAAAVVVVVGLAGIAFAISSTDDDQSPSPAAVASVAPIGSDTPTTTVAPAMEIVRFTVADTHIPVMFTVPDDWTVEEGWDAHKGSGNGEVGLNFDDIPNIYADGCQWVPVDPPVGSTVDDLTEAWANLPDFAATAAVDVTVDEYVGKQIEFTVPDYEIGSCKGADAPAFGLWTARDHAFPGFEAQGPNQHTRQLVLDVDGTRLVITAYYLPSTSPQDRATLEMVLASIQIG